MLAEEVLRVLDKREPGFTAKVFKRFKQRVDSTSIHDLHRGEVEPEDIVAYQQLLKWLAVRAQSSRRRR